MKSVFFNHFDIFFTYTIKRHLFQNVHKSYTLFLPISGQVSDITVGKKTSSSSPVIFIFLSFISALYFSWFLNFCEKKSKNFLIVFVCQELFEPFIEFSWVESTNFCYPDILHAYAKFKEHMAKAHGRCSWSSSTKSHTCLVIFIWHAWTCTLIQCNTCNVMLSLIMTCLMHIENCIPETIAAAQKD